MATVEPVPDAPAAVVQAGTDRLLVVADYHAGIEESLRYESGVELDSRAETRRERLLELYDDAGADGVLFLGDLAHSFGSASGTERDELVTLFDATTARGSVTVVKGNHDGDIESLAGPDVRVTDGDGVRIGGVGFAHGHTWPNRAVLSADVVCIGHEHPTVRLEDEVGGSRVERVWLRGPLDVTPFETYYDEALAWPNPELVVFPAYNDLTGGTWVNVEEQGFLSPFLPAALHSGDAYLLDGTRLGSYRRV